MVCSYIDRSPTFSAIAPLWSIYIIIILCIVPGFFHVLKTVSNGRNSLFDDHEYHSPQTFWHLNNYQSVRELCRRWSHTLGYPSLNLPLKMFPEIFLGLWGFGVMNHLFFSHGLAINLPLSQALKFQYHLALLCLGHTNLDSVNCEPHIIVGLP